MKSYYNKWRIERRSAGTRRKYCKFVHMPLKRLRFFRSEGYCLYSMGLCYQRRLKLCLGSRKVCVVRYIIVVAKEGK